MLYLKRAEFELYRTSDGIGHWLSSIGNCLTKGSSIETFFFRQTIAKAQLPMANSDH